jgi:hypothetical protein
VPAVPTPDPVHPRAEDSLGPRLERSFAPVLMLRGAAAGVTTVLMLRGAAAGVALRRLGVVLVGLGTVGAVFAACAGASVPHRRAHRVHKTPGRRMHKAVARWPAGIKTHTATWAVDDGCAGGAAASAALVRQWVTYAESNCGPTDRKARADCRAGRRRYCEVMQYLDTDWDFFGGEPQMAGAASTNWWLHEPTPHQGENITTITLGGGFLINQTRPAVRSFFRSFVQQRYDSDDGLLMDWQSPSLPQELYYSTCSCASTREIRSNAALRGEHTAMSAALTHRNGAPFMQVDNSLSPNPYLPQGLNMLDPGVGVVGLMGEGEPEESGVMNPYYSTLLDQLAYIDQRTRAFVVLLSRGSNGASYQAQTRRVQEATMLLGFHGAQVVDEADLEEGSSDLAIWPEEGIYPADPLQSMQSPGGRGCLAGTGSPCSRGGHNNLQVAPGVYRRVFGACYRRRVAIGPCAAIVNNTNNWVIVKASWLKRRFGHQITFVGGDVQSGGKIDPTGATFRAGVTSVGPHDGMLLAS